MRVLERSACAAIRKIAPSPRWPRLANGSTALLDAPHPDSVPPKSSHCEQPDFHHGRGKPYRRTRSGLSRSAEAGCPNGRIMADVLAVSIVSGLRSTEDDSMMPRFRLQSPNFRQQALLIPAARGSLPLWQSLCSYRWGKTSDRPLPTAFD
jgi:hypothetical protein